MEFMDAVSVGKFAEGAEMLGFQALLKFIGHGHHRHAEEYNIRRRAQSSRWRRRSELTMTETELNVMAPLAMMGLSSKPKNG